MGRVAVTGGSGKLGRVVVAELLTAGWEVFNFDQRPPAVSQCPFTRIDFTDYGETVEALTGIDQLHGGVDALVHLAAIPGAAYTAPSVTFANNITSTYNVFAAARLAAIKNIVWASSETLCGYPFEAAPAAVPLTEEMPPLANVTYAMVKRLEEEMAAQYCRLDPTLKMTGLRYSYITEETEYELLPALQADPGARRWDMWSYVDVRDAAYATRLALERQATGMDAIIVAAADTVMERPTRELLAEFFPATVVPSDLGVHQSVLCIAKAARLLGYEPRHTWRQPEGARSQ
jgi:nucleoside-diphosphate-sugar epimerase